MKKYSLAFIILILIISGCKKKKATPANEAADWTLLATVKGVGLGLGMQDMCLSDEKTLWLVGQSNYSIKSTEGGVTWQNFVIDTAATSQWSWYAINFPTSQIGYVAGGENAIYKTTDGGATWKQVFNRGNGNLAASRCINFITADKGFICSDFGILYRTTDGGKTWTDQTIPALRNVLLEKVIFIDDLHGWVSGSMGTLLKTTDGGDTWNIIHSAADVTVSLYRYADPSSIAVLSQNDIFSANGSLMKSTDGGGAWSASEGVLKQGSSLTMKNADESFCYVQPASMAHTYDGGKTWTLFTLDSYGHLPGPLVKYGHSLYGYNSGDQKIYKYNKTW